MNQSFVALGFQDEQSIWIIIGIVLVLLFFVVVVVVIGLVIFFVMRKKRKAQSEAVAQMARPMTAEPIGPYTPEAQAIVPEVQAAVDVPPPAYDVQAPVEEMRVDLAAPTIEPLPASAPPDFDPSRTVAITRENTVTISYGRIKFVSGVLAGQQFEVDPEGAYIGREASLSQIVVADPRISKRHLWIGVRDGQVKIVDENSRNGTFVNDPKSERVTEAKLNPGDTVILGESDVARFEYEI